MPGHDTRFGLFSEDAVYVNDIEDQALQAPDAWSAHILIKKAAVGDTRVIDPPTGAGQRLEVSVWQETGGTDTVAFTYAPTLDGTNDTLTFGDGVFGGFILTSFNVNSALVWRITYNNGGTLS